MQYPYKEGTVGEIRQFPKVVTRRKDDDIPDMRGVRETAERFHLPEHFVRCLALDGKVHAVRAGRKKIYINQQSMVDYLNGSTLERMAL